MNGKKFFCALCKTLGFFILSLMPVVVYIITYTIGNQGNMPEFYENYAVQILSVCFPIIATKICFEENKTASKFIEVILMFICIVYLFTFELPKNLIAPILGEIFFYLTLVTYLGTFILSFATYYQNPISDKKFEKIGRSRDRLTDKMENEVKW